MTPAQALPAVLDKIDAELDNSLARLFGSWAANQTSLSSWLARSTIPDLLPMPRTLGGSTAQAVLGAISASTSTAAKALAIRRERTLRLL